MAVRYININSKEVSGIIVSGDDAQKVFTLFSEKRDRKRIEKRKSSLNSLLKTSLKPKLKQYS